MNANNLKKTQELLRNLQVERACPNAAHALQDAVAAFEAGDMAAAMEGMAQTGMLLLLKVREHPDPRLSRSSELQYGVNRLKVSYPEIA